MSELCPGNWAIAGRGGKEKFMEEDLVLLAVLAECSNTAPPISSGRGLLREELEEEKELDKL